MRGPPVTFRFTGRMTRQEPRCDRQDCQQRGKHPKAEARWPRTVFGQRTAYEQGGGKAPPLRHHRKRRRAPGVLMAAELQDGRG